MSNLLSDFGAEKAILGAILLEYRRVMDLLALKHFDADMFDTRAHKVIFLTMSAMYKEGKCIDTLTLEKRLSDKRNLEDSGGAEFLNQLLDSIPTVAHAEHYVDIVIEKFRLRRIRDCYYDMQQELEGGSTSQELISNLMANMTKHIDVKEGSDPITLHAKSLQEAESAQMQGRPAGIPSFLSTLTDTMGYYIPETMYLIAGRPSDGKTSMAMAEAIHSSVILRVPTAFVSMEMSEKLLREQMAGCIANVSAFSYRRGLYSPAQRARMIQAFDLLSKAPLFINDERMTIEQTVAWLSSMVSKHGVRLVILDYIQLIKASKGTGNLGRTEQVMNWSGDLKAFAKKAGVTMIPLSQLSRQGIKLESNAPAAPMLESLRDSGSLEQDADVVMFIFKKPGELMSNFFSDNDWPMELSVAKSRCGPTGRLPVLFVRSRQRFQTQEGDEFDWTRQMRPELTQGEMGQ